MKHCSECGAQFEPKADWHRVCWTCWRQAKEASIEEDAFDRGFEAGARQSQPEFDQRLLREAVALCHPDRHPDRFQQANDVTRRLLQLRAKVAA